jgi:hypothetical protein
VNSLSSLPAAPLPTERLTATPSGLIVALCGRPLGVGRTMRQQVCQSLCQFGLDLPRSFLLDPYSVLDLKGADL